MNDMMQQSWIVVKKIVAESVKVAQKYSRTTWAATLSLAECLAELCESKVLPDIKRLKEAHLKSVEADTAKKEAEVQAAQAEAQKKMAEATKASNESNVTRRQDAMAKAEKDLKALEVAKSQVEIEQLKQEIENNKIEAKASALAKLIEAISKLNQEGGQLSVDPKNLDRLLGIAPPEIQDSSVSESPATFLPAADTGKLVDSAVMDFSMEDIELDPEAEDDPDQP